MFKINLKYTFIVIIILILGLAFLKINQHKNTSSNHFETNKPTVSTMIAISASYQPVIQSIGNVKASKSIAISSEVPGIVKNVLINSGQWVDQGQVLLVLSAAPIQAELEKAEAILNDDMQNYKRKKLLIPSHYISLSDLAHSKAMVEKDQSDVRQEKAILEQRIIRAPFSGLLGISQAQVGQYLTPGQAIVNLESVDAVYIDFPVPEKWIRKIEVGGVIEVKSDAYPNNAFLGKIISTSQSININNRSLEVRGLVSNSDRKLISGLAVVVSIFEPKQSKLLIPQSALFYNPDGVGVYVVDKQNRVHWRLVVTGERRMNDVVISTGLKNGETIVSAGQDKIDDGMPVLIDNQDLMQG